MSAPPPPPAALIAPVRESMSLETKLARLEAELGLALERGDLDARARARIFRAEAITDRILETDPPFVWLAEGYDVEARLRQLQALADRVVAEVRRDEPKERVFQDVARLKEQVARLRVALRTPGGMPPPPLDSLLAAVGRDSITATVSEGATGE